MAIPTVLNCTKATLDYVHDGDTPIMRVPFTRTIFYEGRVRLARANAPELKAPGGIESRDWTIAWFAQAKEIVVRILGEDNYGRLLCEVWRTPDGANLSDDILAAGMATSVSLREQLAVAL